jgi:hypothetical protein
VAVSATYVAVLSAHEETVPFLSSLLHAERQRRGTRTGPAGRSTTNTAAAPHDRLQKINGRYGHAIGAAL